MPIDGSGVPRAISSYAETRRLLREHGVTPNKRLGQNFIVDPSIAEKIVKAGRISPGDLIIEVGPGVGGLTQILAGQAGRVLAVEIDRRLAIALRSFFEGAPALEIIEGDILKQDLRKLVNDRGYERAKIIANLPYCITTPFIMRILENRCPIEKSVITIQKEVAERLRARPGAKEYGAVTVAVYYYAAVEVLTNIPPECFYPKPAVDSAVVAIIPRDAPGVDTIDEKLFFSCVRAGFGNRRKTLVNCLCGMDEAVRARLSKTDIAGIVRACGFDENVRGEAVSPEGFGSIANALAKKIG